MSLVLFSSRAVLMLGDRCHCIAVSRNNRLLSIRQDLKGGKDRLYLRLT
jgi:hypothetical protein